MTNANQREEACRRGRTILESIPDSSSLHFSFSSREALGQQEKLKAEHRHRAKVSARENPCGCSLSGSRRGPSPCHASLWLARGPSVRTGSPRGTGSMKEKSQEPLNLTALSVDPQPEASGSRAAAPEARGAGAAPEGRRPGPPAQPLRPAGRGAAPQPAAGLLRPAQGPAAGRPVCLPDPRQPALRSCFRDHPGHF